MDVLPVPKYMQVANLLQQRIAFGDYLLKEFPTDRDLSAEFEVDTRTARKAVARLIEAGLLKRQSNGRPVVRSVGEARRKQLRVALLTVAYPTPFTGRWQRAIESAIEKSDGMFRLVTYSHLDDAIVKDTLTGFDGVFLGLPGGDPTEHFLRTVRKSRTPVVFLDSDLSDHGFPSLWLAAPSFTSRLLDHLGALGHSRVACLNTQPHNGVTLQRINAWKQWTDQRGQCGRLIDEPVESFGSPNERAYQAATRVILNGGFDATALLCCTSAAAKGVYRAMHEQGMVIGKDLAICSSDDGAGESKFFIPSLTAITDPDAAPYVSVCLDWMAGGGRNWKGPLLVQPKDVPISVGESTAGVAHMSATVPNVPWFPTI